ncbi:T9SS type A sorting domain-containing protein [Flavobacterium sp. JP2137]|uniref:type IX secretion system anionic LPS delivery protein PorZ n=1 Tax=Flavobacterium sp. JP2137 TaxID=3414510 RepID=UPI003D2FB309
MKSICYLFVLFIGLSGQAQTHSWKGYFSYAQVTAVTASPTQVYAAAGSSILIFDIASKQVETVSSIEGLKTQEITALWYSEKFKKLIVGNEDGSLQILHRPTGKITVINDILNKTSIPPTAKRINALIESGGDLLISTQYGISVLNLNNNAFGDTYFIGESGENIQVKQTVVIGNWIYAATEEGIKRGLLSNPNLVDFAQWEVYDYGKWNQLFAWSGRLAGIKDDDKLYRFNGDVAAVQHEFQQPVLDVQVSADDQLIATTAAGSSWFTAQGDLIVYIPAQYELSDGFTSALIVGNEGYIGTNSGGLLQYEHSMTQQPNSLSPEGPLSNRVFSLLKTDAGLWMIFGGYNKDYNPHNPGLASYGMSFFSANKGWDQLPYQRLKNAQVLSYAAVNPRKPGHLYVSSFHTGFLDITLKNQDLKESEVVLYNHLNTGANGLQKVEAVPVDYTSVRINGTAFDAEGNAWMTNSLVSASIKEMRANGEWTSYSLKNSLSEVDKVSFGVPLIDKNGTKWMGTNNRGLVGFNEKKGLKTLVLNTTIGNMPDVDVRSIALDNNNQLWIGTYKGLRVLPSVDRFLNEAQLTANSIIIKEDGIAQELFYHQSITKIKVDGANNKWVALADAGVFLVSPNGQKTLQRFTKDNSPLPSNNISDIEIDGVTGEVFFATDKGMVSFKGSATAATTSFSNVFAYPNPVRPEFNGDVKISGLMDKSNVKITDVEGNLVFEATAEGGTVLWNTYSLSGNKVNSGVYLILVSSKDGTDKTVKKIMVIR